MRNKKRKESPRKRSPPRRSLAKKATSERSAAKRSQPRQPKPPPEQLNIEQVIERLEQEGGERLKTASPRQSAYETCIKLRFRRCLCSETDETYRGHDYIARGKTKAVWYISFNGRTGGITCGTKGYHFQRPKVKCCV